MKGKWLFRLSVLLFVVASLLLTAAVPVPAQGPIRERSELVRLTVKNRNATGIWLKLNGPGYYWLRVNGEETNYYTVKRGSYDYTVYGCGASAQGTLDMSRQQILIMPVCGGNVPAAVNQKGKVDLSSALKIVAVSITNDSDTRMLVILTGPSTYVFTFNTDETKDYTIVKGEYTVKYYACGSVATRSLEAMKGSSWKLTCP